MRLCCETLKHRKFLDQFLNDKDISQILKADGIDGNKDLARVVIYELVFGRGIKFLNGKLKQAARLVNQAIVDKQIELETAGLTADSMATEAVSVKIPRYARVNTLLISLEDALNVLKDEGWIISPVEAEHFKEKVETMTKYDVFIDPHVENLLVFPPNSILFEEPLVFDGKLILQDKASCLPAYILNPEPGSFVFDACAAPGNKTSHMAAIMKNDGKILACDLSKERTETLKQMMKKAGVTIAKVGHGDFLDVDVNDPEFEQIKYVIVDPPCSGSGIAKRADFMSEDKKIDRNRVEKLHNLQVMLLRHALNFPNVKKVIYSTCSVHAEENEHVVAEILADDKIGNLYKLSNPTLNWVHRGDEEFEWSNKVLRADPENDLTNGFFVALFKRIKKY